MKLSTENKTNRKGFTLIELLVVIAIIATLGGVAYGPIMNHLSSADILKAKKVCKDLTASVDLFETEYDSLPYTGSYPGADELVDTDDNSFLNVLIGIDTDVNDRGKEFFTAETSKGTKDGMIYSDTGAPEKLLDKWGNAYHILLNYDGDGELDPADIGPGATGSSYEKILRIDNAIAASPGPVNDGDTAPLFNDKKDAKSW